MSITDPRTGKPYQRKPKRTRAQRGRPTSRGPLWKAVRRKVRKRSGGQCEARTPKCTGTAHHVHHLMQRARGGPDVESNLLDVCHACHKAAHDHPDWAYRHGLLRRSLRADPIIYPGCPVSCPTDHATDRR